MLVIIIWYILIRRSYRVFAQRLGTSQPFWNPLFRRFEWERFATRTVPVIPHLRGDRITIPWPNPEKPTYPERKPSDSDILCSDGSFSLPSNTL